MAQLVAVGCRLVCFVSYLAAVRVAFLGFLGDPPSFLDCVRDRQTTAVKWARTRRLVLDRDEETCVRCGREACDVHHRLPKGMGGTSDEEVAYGLANLISLCRACHSYVHAHPVDAYQTGYLVHSWDDPETIAVLTKSRGAVSFRSDGSSEPAGVCDLFLPG